MAIDRRFHAAGDGGQSQAVPIVRGQGRRRFHKTLAASALAVLVIGLSAQASGPGGGGWWRRRGRRWRERWWRGGGGPKPAAPLVGSWFTTITPIGGTITFQTVVTFTTNGQFTWEQTNPLTGQVVTVQGSYTLGPLPTNSLTFLTLVSQGQIVFQGLFVQPGPGEFIIETFAT